MRSRAFTLIEVMLAVAILAVIAALAVPSMIGLVQGAHVRASIESVGAILDEARSRANAEGRCFNVTTTGSDLSISRLTSADCAGATDAFSAPVHTVKVDPGIAVTITDTSAQAADHRIIFRPSGRLRGTGLLTTTQYGARVQIRLNNTNAFAVADITSLGRFCLRTSTSAPAALVAPVTCP